MRQASAVIGPSESATRSCDGSLLSAPTLVTPSKSPTTRSYCRFNMRGTCVVDGIPGVHVVTTLPAGSAMPVPPVPAGPLAPMPLDPAIDPDDCAPPDPPNEGPACAPPGAFDPAPHATNTAETTASAP